MTLIPMIILLRYTKMAVVLRFYEMQIQEVKCERAVRLLSRSKHTSKSYVRGLKGINISILF